VFAETNDERTCGAVVYNQDIYTREEMREVFWNKLEFVEDMNFDACTIEDLENGLWDLDETKYYIVGGCVVIPEHHDVGNYEGYDGTYVNLEDPMTVFDSINIHV